MTGSNSAALPALCSKMTFPLAMNVSTPVNPNDRKRQRNCSMVTVCPPTLTARRKA